jgi:hypothetical protein
MGRREIGTVSEVDDHLAAARASDAHRPVSASCKRQKQIQSGWPQKGANHAKRIGSGSVLRVPRLFAANLRLIAEPSEFHHREAKVGRRLWHLKTGL